MRIAVWVGVLVAGSARADDVPDGERIEIVGTAPETTRPPTYTLTPADINTMPGAANDALRAALALPSTARIPYSFGGLVLRGMSPRETRVLIDGVEIPIAFHFGGITSVFPTSLLEDMQVIPSGFDVSIGRAQGGVVELTSRRPRGDRWRVGGEVSLLHSAVDLEGPLPGDGAFLFGLRRSYLDVLAKPVTDDGDVLPSYLDGQLRAVWGPLQVYALGSLDRLANSPEAAQPNAEPGYESASLGFVRLGARYERRWGATRLTVAPFVGTNVLASETKRIDFTSAVIEQQMSRRWYQFGGRAELARDTDHGFWRGGLDVDGGYLGRVSSDVISEDTIDPDLPLPRNTVLWTNAAAWLETRRAWDDGRVSVRPGVRVERFGLGRETVVDPRLAAHLALTEHAALRATAGRYHQPPSPAHFDEFLDNLDAKSSYVDQTTLAVEWAPDTSVAASATGFWNEGRRTLVDIPGKTQRGPVDDLDVVIRELLVEQVGFYGYQANVGRERSYGIELSAGYATDRVRALANFTWSRALRMGGEPMAAWEPYALDQPLRLNVLAATRRGKWSFGARLSAASGDPVHLYPLGTPLSIDAGPPSLTRLPAFWQLDVRVDRELDHNLRLFVDIQNATYHQNVEGRENIPAGNDPGPYYWGYRDTHGIPIIPLVGLVLVPDA